MKKILLLVVIAAIHISCSTTQNTMDAAWVGKTKQSFVKNWGPPVRTLNNDSNGEILIYADQVYANPNNQHNNVGETSNYWNYMFVYINKEGKIASWRKEKQVFPPQQIDAGYLTGKNAVSVK